MKAPVQKKKVFNANKNKKVLSFANNDDDDSEDDDGPVLVKKGGIKSQHDSIASKHGV